MSLITVLLLAGCGNIWSTREAFVAGKNPMPSINGATVFPRLVPMGGEVSFGLNTMIYFAGVESASSPYAIYVVAHGTPAVHETLTIRELKLHTSYGKTELVPYSMLGNPVPFKPTTDPSIVQATYGCDVVWNPGTWAETGPVDVEIKATVTANGKEETHTFVRTFKPEVRKERQFESISGELIRVIRRKERLVAKP